MNSTKMQQEPPKLSSKLTKLWSRLSRSKEARERFVESHSAKAIAFQIRAMRRTQDWSQEQFAEACGMTQNMISRLESPEYGRPSVTTLRRIAAAFDVALAVRFVPFSELAEWVATLSPDRMDVRPFSNDSIHWGHPVSPERDTSSFYRPTQAARNFFHESVVVVEDHPRNTGNLVSFSGGTGLALDAYVEASEMIPLARSLWVAVPSSDSRISHGVM